MQRHQNDQNNFGKKEQSQIVTYPDFHLKVRDNATFRAPGPCVPSLGGCKMSWHFCLGTFWQLAGRSR